MFIQFGSEMKQVHTLFTDKLYHSCKKSFHARTRQFILHYTEKFCEYLISKIFDPEYIKVNWPCGCEQLFCLQSKFGSKMQANAIEDCITISDKKKEKLFNLFSKIMTTKSKEIGKQVFHKFFGVMYTSNGNTLYKTK